MKYREIAKRYLLDNGSKRPVVAEDGQTYHDEGARDFTPKQTEKVQAAVSDLEAQLSRKWFKEEVKKTKKKK